MKEEKNKKEVNSKPKKNVTKKPVSKSSTKTSSATKKAPVKKIVEKKVPAKKTTSKKVEEKKVPAKKNVTKKVVKKPVANKIEKKFEWKQYFYYIAFILILIIVIIGIWDITTYYAFDNSNTSYLVSSRTIKKNKSLVLKHAKETFINLKGDYFVYVGYTGDKSIYSLERKMRKVIKDYDIEDRFYYVNVDDLKTEDSRLEKINYYLNLKDAKISKVPTIYYVDKDNEVTYNNIITRTDGNAMEIGDFQKLLDINGFTKK